MMRSIFIRAGSNGFSSFRFDHDALPEIDFAKIRLETELFGKKLAAPLIIGAMTGGTEKTRRDQSTARACG